jgi:hypothetical protein
MKKSVPAESPDAYIASLDGWRSRQVQALRSAVVGAAPLREVVKWGHLVYYANGPVLLIRAKEACPARALAAAACEPSSAR